MCTHTSTPLETFLEIIYDIASKLPSVLRTEHKHTHKHMQTHCILLTVVINKLEPRTQQLVIGGLNSNFN